MTKTLAECGRHGPIWPMMRRWFLLIFLALAACSGGKDTSDGGQDTGVEGEEDGAMVDRDGGPKDNGLKFDGTLPDLGTREDVGPVDAQDFGETRVAISD